MVRTRLANYPHFCSLTSRQVDGKLHQGTYIKPLLAELVRTLPNVRKPSVIPKLSAASETKSSRQDIITQDWVWGRLAQFFEPGDVVFGDTGTCTFGLHGESFTPGSQYAGHPTILL